MQHKFQCAFTGYTGSLSWLTRALKCNDTINIFIYTYFSLYKPKCLPRKREATSTTTTSEVLLPAVLVNVNTADLSKNTAVCPLSVNFRCHSGLFGFHQACIGFTLETPTMILKQYTTAIQTFGLNALDGNFVNFS